MEVLPDESFPRHAQHLFSTSEFRHAVHVCHSRLAPRVVRVEFIIHVPLVHNAHRVQYILEELDVEPNLLQRDARGVIPVLTSNELEQFFYRLPAADARRAKPFKSACYRV